MHVRKDKPLQETKMSQPVDKLSRRTLFTGAATAGALGAVATLLPRAVDPGPPVPALQELPARGGGYQVSDHVLKYYKSTRI